MTAAWGGILSSDPPAAGVSVRPTRLTFDGISANKAFTVSVPSIPLVAETDYCGIVSGYQHNKFGESYLTPVPSTLVKAPYPDECPLVMECRLHKTLELGSHVLFVGHILNVLAEETVLTDGEIDTLKTNPVVYGPDQGYFSLGEKVAKAFSVGKKLFRGRGE
jgi:flavin reductase (DIM6/NTAB) family NADH-FMN oxidoreductase RutF